MDIPDRLITLQQNADAEYAKLAGLLGEEREAQWKRWYEAAVEIQAAVTAHAQETGTPRNQTGSWFAHGRAHGGGSEGGISRRSTVVIKKLHDMGLRSEHAYTAAVI
ncbi:hypothetical protein ABZ553_12060, partial [Streptomyces sparsogenes]|uniref:hypothetical protein n=1 Tax=Streptomyces sparsogenes TaxID=67365 RepID=UPI00340E9710